MYELQKLQKFLLLFPIFFFPTLTSQELRGTIKVKQKNDEKMVSPPSFSTYPNSLSKPSSVLSSYYTQRNCSSNCLHDAKWVFEYK